MLDIQVKSLKHMENQHLYVTVCTLMRNAQKTYENLFSNYYIATSKFFFVT